MSKPLFPSSFQEPSADDDAPLFIYVRGKGTANEVLAIFVHGLGGRRYGKKATWGHFPKFIYEDLPNVDVGLYAYRTLFKRFKIFDSVSLDVEAEVFAGILRENANYKTVILLGHSLGGLLCKAVISRCATTNQPEILSRIGGLFLMATPRQGHREYQDI